MPEAGRRAVALIDVKTDITGNVRKILVKPGDHVVEDEPLLILESMKMEIPVSAPEAGKVAEILTVEGATVPEGTVLVRLDV
jgi:acetyl-CoA carboxylase biotin carboxyl carrier protein